jgi:hypothetical protein
MMAAEHTSQRAGGGPIRCIEAPGLQLFRSSQVGRHPTSPAHTGPRSPTQGNERYLTELGQELAFPKSGSDASRRSASARS